MNKYNIEVGDKLGTDVVTLVDKVGISFSKDRFPSVHLYSWEYIEGLINKSKGWKLIKATKMSKKIIGYTLLKDTPDCKADTIFRVGQQFDTTTTWYSGEDNDGRLTYFSKERISNTEWFSPIYEEVKPTEVFVDTLAGKVKVTKNWLSMEGEQPIPMENAQKLINSIKNFYFGKLQVNELHAATIETFSIGCKVFNAKSDIPKLEEAIKQVS